MDNLATRNTITRYLVEYDSPPPGHLSGDTNFYIDLPKARSYTDAGRIRISGWVFGTAAKATEVFVRQSSRSLLSMTVAFPRPDVEEHFEGATDALYSGFSGTLDFASVDLEGKAELDLEAVLENGAVTPLGHVKLSRLLGEPPPDAESATEVQLQRRLILLANSRRRSDGWNLGKLEPAGKANSAVPDAPDEFANSIRLGRDHKAYIASRFLRGSGLEIGALHMPMAVPSSCQVTYVDRYDVDGLRRHYPELGDKAFVPVDVIDDGEKLRTIAAESQHFIIASHFLEHCQDPIGTIQRYLELIKPSGIIFLAIPDKRFLHYDAKRPVARGYQLQHPLPRLDAGCLLGDANRHPPPARSPVQH
jgi:hypothetical protein